MIATLANFSGSLFSPFNDEQEQGSGETIRLAEVQSAEQAEQILCQVDMVVFPQPDELLHTDKGGSYIFVALSLLEHPKNYLGRLSWTQIFQELYASELTGAEVSGELQAAGLKVIAVPLADLI